MPHGPFAKRRRSPAAYAVGWLHSPEGTKVNSPRRKPWVTAHHRTKPRRGGRDLSPLRGWVYSTTRHPGLTPGAIHFRPFGAIFFRGLARARRCGSGPRETTVGFPTKPRAAFGLVLRVCHCPVGGAAIQRQTGDAAQEQWHPSVGQRGRALPARMRSPGVRQTGVRCRSTAALCDPVRLGTEPLTGFHRFRRGPILRMLSPGRGLRASARLDGTELTGPTTTTKY